VRSKLDFANKINDDDNSTSSSSKFNDDGSDGDSERFTC
jgi:hypothetical protein